VFDFLFFHKSEGHQIQIERWKKTQKAQNSVIAKGDSSLLGPQSRVPTLSWEVIEFKKRNFPGLKSHGKWLWSWKSWKNHGILPIGHGNFCQKDNHYRSLTIKFKEYKTTISKTNVWILAFQFAYLLFYLRGWWFYSIKFDVSNTSCWFYCVEVENGALLHDVMQSWKMILGGHGKFLWKKCGNPASLKTEKFKQVLNRKTGVQSVDSTNLRCISIGNQDTWHQDPNHPAYAYTEGIWLCQKKSYNEGALWLFYEGMP